MAFGLTGMALALPYCPDDLCWVAIWRGRYIYIYIAPLSRLFASLRFASLGSWNKIRPRALLSGRISMIEAARLEGKGNVPRRKVAPRTARAHDTTRARSVLLVDE